MNSFQHKALLLLPIALATLLLVASHANASALLPNGVSEFSEIAIVSYEDHRDYSTKLALMLSSQNAALRNRAVLAAGRIGDPRAAFSLTKILRHDQVERVRETAAFALGVMRSPSTVHDLIAVAEDESQPVMLRARCVEALGQIATVLAPTDSRLKLAKNAIESVMLEDVFGLKQSTALERLGVVAFMRVKTPNAAEILTALLYSKDPQTAEDAELAIGRIGPPAESLPILVIHLSSGDPLLRANACYALGKAKYGAASSQLLEVMVRDSDERVRVGAIRALGAIGRHTASRLIEQRIDALLNEDYDDPRLPDPVPASQGELLELATALGQIEQGTHDIDAYETLWRESEYMHFREPEVETSMALVNPATYAETRQAVFTNFAGDKHFGILWPQMNASCQALSALADTKFASDPIVRTGAENYILSQIAIADSILHPAGRNAKLGALIPVTDDLVNARENAIAAYAEFKPEHLDSYLAKYVHENDVYIRATVVGIIGGEPPLPSREKLLSRMLKMDIDTEPNDVAIGAVNGLAAQHTRSADQTILAFANCNDCIVRREIATALQKNGYSLQAEKETGICPSPNSIADYRRAVDRENRHVSAVVLTQRGAFSIRLLASDAPLTVDNFVQLSKRHFYTNLIFHRVVPNFVIQGGDPRGSGEGGPNYQIRDEMNRAPYTAGAVGMALSGKDTGGSQWFVTHSPQHRLDGGYTVFGQVTSGQDVVDKIQRGDKILSIKISEN